jgi:hypothetical protein
LASEALQTIAHKRRKEADDELQKKTTALSRAQNKQAEELRQEGVVDRQDERERKKLIQQHQTLGITIPTLTWVPIHDRQKDPTAAETEGRRIALQSLVDAVADAQRKQNETYAANPESFTSIPIDPAIIEEERRFQLSQRGGLQMTILVDLEEEEEGDESGDESMDEDYPRSVASIDSIAENADFVTLE